jgi:hypothetical protein
MPVPDFSPGEVLTAAAMDSIGLWLVKTQTVSSSPAVTSVTVTDAFSADYDNYRIIYDGGTHSGGGSLNLQFGSTTSGYHYAYIFNQYSATAVVGGGSTVATNFDSIGRGATNGNNLNCDVFGPFLSQRTGVKYLATDYLATGFNVNGTGFLDDATSYTSFTILVAGGFNITGGTIRVYGYRN